jgi:hypothetical protein
MRETAHNSHPAEYKRWSDMMARCYNPNNASYAAYGGRGIKVAECWRTFDGFLSGLLAIGPPPTTEHSLDRIDNEKDYEPNNIRWATPTEQANNRRSNKLVVYKGREQTVAEWAREFGLSAHMIYNRLSLGWSVQDLFETPSDARKRTKRSAPSSPDILPVDLLVGPPEPDK